MVQRTGAGSVPVRAAGLRTDRYGIIREADEQADALLGSGVRALVGKPLIALVDAPNRAAFRRLINDAATRGTGARTTLRLRNGPAFHRLTGAESSSAVPVGVPAELDVELIPERRPDGAVTALLWQLHPLPPGSGRAELPSSGWLRPVESAPAASPYFADLLARVGGALSASIEDEVALRSVVALLVPALGDWCLLDLLREEGGRLRRVAVACSATEPAELRRPLRAAPGRDAGPIARAIEERRTQLLRDPEPADLDALSASPEQRAALAALSPATWLAVPLLVRGRCVGVLSCATCGSQRRVAPISISVAEEVARRAAVAVDNGHLYRVAQRGSEAKSALLATMSHELRTPLTAIIGYTELMRDGLVGPVRPEQDVFLARIRESSDHLLGLVEQILECARLEAGEVRLACEPVELGRLARQAVGMVEPVARRRGLAFHVEVPDRRGLVRERRGTTAAGAREPARQRGQVHHERATCDCGRKRRTSRRIARTSD